MRMIAYFGDVLITERAQALLSLTVADMSLDTAPMG